MISEIYLVKKSTSKSNQSKYLNQLLNDKNPKYFSKSYSGEYAVVIISSMNPVAIDIEIKKSLTQEQMDIYTSFMYNNNDCISYSKVQQENFFKIWVIKEVYSKYFGEGLYIDFKEISIEQDELNRYKVSYKNKNHVTVKIIEQNNYVVAYICNHFKGENKNGNRNDRSSKSVSFREK
ncbi:4'-phosphopantetheinyl transferase family protein [Candidatus Enterococcus mansonii]|uniref:4'-phosphopantetheinyl transferase family protein n=1 Tax=Candidatus Enterococcus mansonii TaxID=1834181 RepID=UPI0030147250